MQTTPFLGDRQSVSFDRCHLDSCITSLSLEFLGEISQLLALNLHFNNLIDALIVWHIKLVLFRHRVRQEPPTHKMRPVKVPHERLRCRQTDQRGRHKLRPWPILRRTIRDTPRGRGIHGEHRHFRTFEGGNDAAKGIADFAGEAEAEDCVDDVVGAGERGGEVVGEGDGKGAKLGCEAVVDVLLGWDWVEDGGVVAEVVEMPSCY